MGDSIAAALEEASSAGLSDSVAAVSEGNLKLKQLNAVIEELQVATAARDLEALSRALVKAEVVGLQGKAKEDAQELRKKLQEEELQRKLKEEAEKQRLQQEEEDL